MGYMLEFYSVSWAKLEADVEKHLALKPASTMMEKDSSDDQIEAFIELVKQEGTFLGSLDHASASAEEFLEGFMIKVLRKCFPKAKLEKQLLERPLFGLKPPTLPAWGGLKKEELAKLLAIYKEPNEEDLDDDCASWLADLVEFFQWAVEMENDLITLYC
jgi:hypothetical protein